MNVYHDPILGRVWGDSELLLEDQEQEHQSGLRARRLFLWKWPIPCPVLLLLHPATSLGAFNNSEYHLMISLFVVLSLFYIIT